MEQKNGIQYQPTPVPGSPRNAVPAAGQRNQMDSGFDINPVEILFTLLHHWKAIVLCALIGAVIAGNYYTMKVRPSYRASTEMYITSTDSVINVSDLSLGSTLSTDYQNIIVSRSVLNQVIEDLQLNTNYRGLRGLISVSIPSGTHIIRTYVTTGDLTLSRDIANDLLLVSIDRIYQVFGTKEPSIIEYSQAEAIDYVAPSIIQYMEMGAAVGAVIMAALVVLQSVLNTTLKTDEDAEKHLGLPVLAVVPYYRE